MILVYRLDMSIYFQPADQCTSRCQLRYVDGHMTMSRGIVELGQDDECNSVLEPA